MARIRFGVWATIWLLRCLVCGVWLSAGISGQLWGVLAFGLAELHAVTLALLNERRKESADLGAGALLVPALYLVGCCVSPVGLGSVYGQWALTAVSVALFATRCFLGTSYSVAGTTWLQLVEAGPYRWLRHPMLALQALSRLIVFLEFPTLPHLAAAVVYAGLVVAIVLVEERWLSTVPAWSEYAGRVRWRLLPGVW